MGSAGYRNAEMRYWVYSSLIKGETKFLLQIKGHRRDEANLKCSNIAPVKSLDELTDEMAKEYIKNFEKCGNALGSLELYKVSVRKDQKKLAGAYIGSLLAKICSNKRKPSK